MGAVGEECPDLDAVKALRGGGRGFFGPHVLEICGQADCVFLALHGLPSGSPSYPKYTSSRTA